MKKLKKRDWAEVYGHLEIATDLFLEQGDMQDLKFAALLNEARDKAEEVLRYARLKSLSKKQRKDLYGNGAFNKDLLKKVGLMESWK